MVKDFENTGYWAIILGGSSGLGLASAKKLAKHGMHICIIHRSPRKEMVQLENDLEALKSFGVEVISYNFNALDAEKSDFQVSELKKIIPNKKVKLLLHSIAKGNVKPMISDKASQLSVIDYNLTIQAMAVSLYDWVQRLLTHQFFAPSARILSFTSEGNTKVWRNYAAVSAAKSALESITRSLAVELAPQNITANCIQAGVTDTASFRKIPDSEMILNYTLQRNPFGRITQPEDVANVVYLLCKEEAKWINGTIIKVDGGEHLS